VPVDDNVGQPQSRNPTPWTARSDELSQRATTASTSKLGSLPTVINARGVAKAASSLVMSLPLAASRSTA
jgi:hypothetical protein